MLFNSYEFLIFFPLVTIIYFLLPHRFRWFHLLMASCIFYMYAIPVYILILFLTIVIDYVAGIMIEGAEGRRRKSFLILSIVTNVGVLAFFKYGNFFIDNVNAVLHFTGSIHSVALLNILLPIGLSFHTFQAMSYTIEVYRGNQKAERHFGIYALYVMFYPQLVAGPIERPQNILHQFYEHHHLRYSDVVSGLRQMMWGVLKKAVIADRLGLITGDIFSKPHQYSGTALAIGAVFFAFQLYCDFSGYTDIALGAAKVMGFHLMVNFNYPFSSKSITEFWRRWHISLSTWFYDYLFNPIVLSARSWGKAAIVFGLLFTFGMSGFWHGAGWKFIIYGLLNGMALVYEYFTKKQRKKLFGRLPKTVNDAVSRVITIGFITYTWIFFRASNVKDAFYISRRLLGIPAEILQVIRYRKISFLNLPGIFNIVIPAAGMIVVLEILQHYIKGGRLQALFIRQPRGIRWAIYAVAFYAIIYAGVFGSRNFIYFQF